MKNLVFILILIFGINGVLKSQEESRNQNLQYYDVSDDFQYAYPKPKVFDLFTNIPKNYVDLGKKVVKPNGLKWLGITAIATALILPSDQDLLIGVQNVSDAVDLSQDHRYNKIVGGVEYPTNVSAGFYHLGHGNVSLLFAAGFLTTGLIKKDYRAIHTSVEIGESILTLGVMTQGLKRVFGRQSPNRATVDGGEWNFFPNLKEYMKNTPNYDAFPSGHMATLTSTVTVIAKNYPEIKWIKPVGYTMMGLLGFEMVNSGVHWAADYPLGILIGYSVATVSVNRRITKVEKTKLSYGKVKYYPEFTVTSFFGNTLIGCKVSF